MAINAGTVLINVVANVGPFRQQMLGLGGVLSKTGSLVSRFGVGLTRAVSLPLGLAGAAAVKTAVDFDTAFTKINAVTGASRKEIEKWKEQVQTLGAKTATDPTQLANALYFLASAGLKSSQIMPALVASAKAAAAGLGETADIARLTANAMNAYSESGLKASEVTDTLVAAVREGTAEPDEFATAMGRILPIASKAGVEFNNLAASLAVVSNIGLDVNEGVTAMRGLLQALVAPGTQAAETLKEIGLTSQEVRDQLEKEGILSVVREIEDRTKQEFGKGWLDAARKIIPNIRALTGALGLTVQEGERVDEVFQKVAHSTGDAEKAFGEAQKGAAFQFRQTLVKLKNIGIEIGNILIPILQDVAKEVEKLIKWFAGLSDSTKEMIVKIGLFAIAFGPLLRIGGALITIFSGAYKAISGVIGLAGKLAGVTASLPQQLTLFGPEAAGGASVAAPIIGVLAAIAAVAIGAKIAIDNANEAIDRNVELLRQGVVSGQQFVDKNEELNNTLGEFTRRAQSNIPVGRAFAAGQQGIQNRIDANQKSIFLFTQGIRDMSESFGATEREQSVLASVFKTSIGTTETYRHHIAALVGAYHTYGLSVENVTSSEFQHLASLGKHRQALDLIRDKVSDEVFTLIKQKLALGDVSDATAILTRNFKDNTLQQVKNLLAVGDVRAAYRLLQRDFNQATKGLRDNARETQKNVTENRNLETAMKISAGTGQSLKKSLKDVESAAKAGRGPVKDLGDRVKELPKAPVIKPKVDTSQATGPLSRLDQHLTNITSRDWVANVRVTTTGGSTGFHLLEELEKVLELITEDGKWQANVLVTAGGPAGRGLSEVSKIFADQSQLLEKLGRIAQQVFGEDFPKAYKDDLAAFKDVTQEKSKELERQLKSAQKAFDKLKEKVDSFRDAIKSGFTDAGGLISGAVEGIQTAADNMKSLLEDPENFGGGATVFDPTTYLQQQLQANAALAQKLGQLAAAGLAPSLLAELAQGGQQSIPLIDALLAGGTDLIKQFNLTEKQLNAFANATANALSEESFGGAIKKARKNINDLSDDIQRFNQRIANQIENFVQALQARRVGDSIEALIQSLNRALRQLGVNVPHAASGGIVTRPTMLLAGEAGPEAIVPLGRGGYGGDVVVNVTVKGNAVYAQDLAEEIRSILLRDKRHKGGLGLA